jgi:sterol desaturase/sphingolipid hydroxylase (fatty acid hydroxylase superfamily)
MRFVSTLLDYLIWPGILAFGCVGVGIGMHYGHVPLAFNITYLLVALAIFFLERWRPHEDYWLENDGQMPADLAHTLFTKIFVQVLVMSATFLGLTAVSKSGSSGFWPGHWPMFWQVVLALVLGEFGLYWAHRVAHVWGPLWRFHAIHHSVKRLWFFNTGRFHFMDTLKSIVFAIPFLSLSGAPENVMQWFGAITAFIGILTHCNIDVKFGWLNYIFNTSGLHRWHHSMDLREGNKNYGENLMLWDLIFGSYFDDSKRRPPVEIGIKEAMPTTFMAQLAMPFRWRKFQDEVKAGMHQEKIMQKRPILKKEKPAAREDEEISSAEILEA